MGKKLGAKKYIDYDYESIYRDDLTGFSQPFIDSMLSGKIESQVYVTKTIKAGNQVEVEIYPAFTRRQIRELSRGTSKAQSNLNDKNARKKIERRINHNFGKGDLWGTLTYREKDLPTDLEEASKNMKNFIRRLKNRRKREGVVSDFKYIYVTELSSNGRIHHHFIMDHGLSMDVVESIWKHGDRNELRRLDYSLQDGLSGVANYLVKDQKFRGKSKKRWCCSKNLKDPIPSKNHSKFRNSHVIKMVKNQNIIAEMLEAEYKNCMFKYAEVKHNDFNGKFYIYARMYECRSDDDVPSFI